MRISSILLVTFVWGCVPSGSRAPERVPVRWVVVEKPVGDVLPQGQSGDGRVDPGAHLLSLQPLYREDLQWEVVVDPRDYFVEVLEVLPGSSANPGEVVSAKVRVGGAKAGEMYRLTATVSRPDVQLLGDREQLVRGNAPAVFRFTSSSTGAGGIAVGVERLPRGRDAAPQQGLESIGGVRMMRASD